MVKDQLGLSYLHGDNAYYIEQLYEQYLNDPKSINDYWCKYFDELITLPGNVAKDLQRLSIEKSISEYTRSHAKSIVSSSYINSDYVQKYTNVIRLIVYYRILGSRKANLDPLKRFSTRYIPELDSKNIGISKSDMSQIFPNTNTYFITNNPLPLSEIVNKLEQTYCGNIGTEFMHIMQPQERQWIMSRLERELSQPRFNSQQKIHILKKLTAAETLERYLHTKYVGQKRFSLEGGDSLIPGMDYLINQSAKLGIEEIVIGMAHRGRLNILVNTLGKLPNDLFAEFEGKQKIELESGDVKYHNGFISDVSTSSGPMHISLEFNPSHLEIVNPVVEGSVRARQREYKEKGKDKVLPVLIHGDAAIIGLGVNQANFNLSQTRGFTTGGTVHIVINNQIGFTTSDVRDIRSTTYCTDIAKMIDAPIFHVNGDDPESVCYVIQLALEFRMQFKKDVVVDLVCYRRLGHNEGDDPLITQPMMYKNIANHHTTREIYAQKLITEGICTSDQTKDLIQQYKLALDKGEHVEKTTLANYKKKDLRNWSSYKKTKWTDIANTAITKQDIKQLTDAFTKIPEGFNLHRTVKKVLENRISMGNGQMPIDWGMAETLAYASLLVNGKSVRISGEDSGRGTFSHRHAVLHDQNRERWDKGVYLPLQHISSNQANFMIIDSILNEEAVLAYEYGFSCSSPEHLVIWEAQFGDFANGAQVPIDQFITSGESKWGRLSGLTVILPHGFDGQGPEHSSARLERWLQLSAEHNIQIVNMTESSQMFHVLRRQILRPYRKPLIIFLSKRLLRYKDSASPIENFINDSAFNNIIGENYIDTISKIILCSGQIYFDLKNQRKLLNQEKDVAIIRIEQLYPFPYNDLVDELKKYPNVKKFVWCQEEPKNQGAWFQIRDKLEQVLGAIVIKFVGRPKSATTAVGYKKKHDEQLYKLLDDAFSNK